MEVVGDGGGGSLEGSIPFPVLDLAALWEAGNTLSSQAQVVAGVGSDLAGAPGRVGSWSGGAADAWHANVKQSLAGVDEVSQRLAQAARILTGLFNTIQGLQTQYNKAAEAELASSQTLAAVHKNGGGQAHAVNPPGSFGWFMAEGAKAAAIRAEQQAVDEVHHQAQMAASRLSGLTAGLPAQVQLGPPSSYRPGAPSRVWIPILLGSVTGNRISGLSFQKLLSDLLGLEENTTTIPVWTQMKDGTWRWVPVKPDTMEPPEGGSPGIVGEVKNTGYQYASTQIRAEIQLAEDDGVPFQLQLPPGARIAGPLQDLLLQVSRTQDEPAVIFTNGDGTATDLNGDEVVANPQTHLWEYMKPGQAPTSARVSGGSTGGGEDGGGDDDGGGGDPDPTGPVDPVDPIDPIDPIP